MSEQILTTGDKAGRYRQRMACKQVLIGQRIARAILGRGARGKWIGVADALPGRCVVERAKVGLTVPQGRAP